MSEPAHYAAFERPARDKGLSMPPGFFHRMVGRTDKDCSEELAQHWGGVVSAAEILQWKIATYPQIALQESTLVPGVIEFLNFIRSQNIRFGIATSANRSDIRPFLDRYDWHDLFSSIFTVNDVVHPKPHPEIYLRSMQALHATPEETLVFEDSPVGAQAARASRANVIGMLTTFTPENLGAAMQYWPDYTDRSRWQIFERP